MRTGMRSGRDWRRAPVVEAGSRRVEAALHWLRTTIPQLRSLRVLSIALVALVVLIALIYGGEALDSKVLARLHLHSVYTWYDFGFYGLAPSMQYRSFAPRVPRMEFPRWDSRCSQDYVFIGWRGHNVEEPAAVILGADQEIVYRQTGFRGDKDDIKPQMYKGQQYLTFYNDEAAMAEDGDENYLDYHCWFMMDETYTVRHKLRPHGFKGCDMHEFHITPDDTALVITTKAIPYDLRDLGGRKEGWLQDCLFQELDIETGELLFQWSAAEHFPANVTMEPQNNCIVDAHARFAGCGNEEHESFDYFHLNSVQKDSKGNYLISARNTWGISYIDGKTGDVLWTIGAGNVNDFEDVSEEPGAATTFSWQHHARWLEEGKSLSFFNNNFHRLGDKPGNSGGRILDLDIEKRKVKLRHAYNHPNHMRPESQGSAQPLNNGNVMVGWGSSGAFTEFAEDGAVLCDGRFGAEALFEFSPVSSYRVLRGNWTGRPQEPPTAVVEASTVYVSWNGATEVERWQVERMPGENDNSDEILVLAQEFKSGFETTIELPQLDEATDIYVVGLSKEGQRLGTTTILEAPATRWSLTPLAMLIIAAVLLILIAVASCVGLIWWKCLRERRRQRVRYQPLGVEGRPGATAEERRGLQRDFDLENIDRSSEDTVRD